MLRQFNTCVLISALSAQSAFASNLPQQSVPSVTAASPNSTAPAGAARVSDNWTSPVVPSQEIIRRSVRQTIQDDDAAEKAAAEKAAKAAAIPVPYRVSSAPALTPMEKFEKGVEAAKIPDCLRPDGLKHQKTYIFGGLLALPFIPIAKLRGKCK